MMQEDETQPWRLVLIPVDGGIKCIKWGIFSPAKFCLLSLLIFFLHLACCLSKQDSRTCYCSLQRQQRDWLWRKGKELLFHPLTKAKNCSLLYCMDNHLAVGTAGWWQERGIVIYANCNLKVIFWPYACTKSCLKWCKKSIWCANLHVKEFTHQWKPPIDTNKHEYTNQAQVSVSV